MELVPSVSRIVGTEIKEEQRWFQVQGKLLELKSRKNKDGSKIGENCWN